jgi:hypothetical protein
MRTQRLIQLVPFVAPLLLVTVCSYRATAGSVFLFSTGDASLDALTKRALEGYGHTVDLGPQYVSFNGSRSLEGYSTVLLVPSVNWFSGDMPVAGQIALKNFVTTGGGLVTGEWLVWKNAAERDFQTLFPAIPVISNSAYRSSFRATYTSLVDDQILNRGVPGQFTFRADDIDGGSETLFRAKAGATAFYGSDYGVGGQGLIGWDYGEGRVLSFSTVLGPLELQDSAYSRLLSNAVDWSASGPGAVPEPSAVVLFGLGALGVMRYGYRWRRAG